MTPRVELLYFETCPHLDAARAQLRAALLEAKLPLMWAEIDVSASNAPDHVRGYGSPTVLVNGADVLGEPPGKGLTCRVYFGSELPGAPPLGALTTALVRAQRELDQVLQTKR